MTERRKKVKKMKGQAVVKRLRMVLLLGSCRGGDSGHEEDRDKSLHDQNRTQTLKIKEKPKKSLFSRTLGLFRKSGAGKNGRNNNTGVLTQVGKEHGEDISGQKDDTGVQTQIWKENGQDVSGQTDDTGVQTQVCKVQEEDITGPNDDTDDLHPIPGPSNHDDLHNRASLLESPESCVDNLNKTLKTPFSGGREKSQEKGKDPAVTPDLSKPRPGPSHTSTTTLPTRTESSGSRKLTKAYNDDDIPIPSNGYLLIFSLSVIVFCFLYLFQLYMLFKYLFH
ncbi:hypothetical protein AOLI_G00160090 [Acnodon oligacanthus]